MLGGAVKAQTSVLQEAGEARGEEARSGEARSEAKSRGPCVGTQGATFHSEENARVWEARPVQRRAHQGEREKANPHLKTQDKVNVKVKIKKVKVETKADACACAKALVYLDYPCCVIT